MIESVRWMNSTLSRHVIYVETTAPLGAPRHNSADPNAEEAYADSGFIIDGSEPIHVCITLLYAFCSGITLTS